MRQWVLGVFAASLIAAAALALCPKGRVYTVTRMVCGLMCALALASPLVRLDPESLSVGLAEYRARAQRILDDEEETGKLMERTYIQEQCAAYICAKAAELGAPVAGAEVLARWDDGALVWYPWSVTVDGAYSAPLAGAIEAELGVPPQRQEWSNDGR